MATVELRVGTPTENLYPITGYDLVIEDDIEEVDDVTCGSEHCGTYSITIVANAYNLH